VRLCIAERLPERGLDQPGVHGSRCGHTRCYSQAVARRASEGTIMEIKESVALVTGANRGIGRAFVRALIDHGAAKVYAGARDPATVTDHDATPLQLDVRLPMT
jgi:hypothetical protein